MADPILRTINLSKTFEIGVHKVKALRGTTIEVMPGEFIAITGPSGSGKTTLLSLIGCLDKPTDGKIIIDSIDVTDISEASLYRIRREKIGFIFQSFNLIQNLSAVENVELPMECSIKSGKQREERASELLNMVGLSGREKHRPMQLSAGEQQRVAVARALANSPTIILADEPTGNLDSETGSNIIEMLRQLPANSQCTVMMVTHDLHMASLAGRTISLRDGMLQ
ncbi:ABC transporter ATP-binding protein [Chloroflexota bacterium]